MPDLSAFSITHRWPPRTPDAIQFYARTTPNGIKISTALEELGLPYDAHHIRFELREQKSADYMSLNPNGKIPSIIDPNGPGGKPLALFESGAILLYLAQKTGRLMPTDPARHWQAVQWLFFQVGGIGPMFGQVEYFYVTDGRQIEDPRPRQRYSAEAHRLLGVLEGQLDGRDWFMGDYSMVDIAFCPWLREIRDRYKVGPEVGWEAFPKVDAWLDRFLARPAVQRGIVTPPRD